MKIWIVHQHAISPSQTGFTRSFDIARILIDLGHSVVLIASSFDHFTKRDIPIPGNESYRYEVVENVPFLWVKSPSYLGNSFKRLWGMFVFCAKVWFGNGLNKLDIPDVIIGSSPSPFAALGAERKAKRLRIPFVLEVRDLWPQTPIELGNYSRINPIIVLMSWVEKHLYRSARIIISLLPYADAHISMRGGDREKISWIPNGVDLTQISNPLPIAADNSCFRVVYAGSHGVANDLGQVVEAARIIQGMRGLKSIVIRLYGNGPEKPHIVQKAKEYGLRNMEFYDSVPKSDIWRILSESHACLMVLRNSPLFRWGVSPNKLFDYMAAARPVIYSVNTSYDPIASSHSGITVSPGDPKSLADGIIKLSQIPLEELQEMGLRARQYVEENHDLSKLALKLHNALTMVKIQSSNYISR